MGVHETGGGLKRSTHHLGGSFILLVLVPGGGGVDRGSGDHGRRLSAAERLEIRRRVATGETHVAVAAIVGCSTKAIQRELVRTGGLSPRERRRSPLRL